MATTHDLVLRVLANSVLQNVGEIGTVESRTTMLFNKRFANGTGADQSDQAWEDADDANNTTKVIDLANAATLNKLGEAISLTKLKGILIIAGAANAVDIEVTMPAGGVPIFKTAADAVLLKPGGIFLYVAPAAAGVAVGAGATDLLHLTAAAGVAAYQVFIWGVE